MKTDQCMINIIRVFCILVYTAAGVLYALTHDYNVPWLAINALMVLHIEYVGSLRNEQLKRTIRALRVAKFGRSA